MPTPDSTLSAGRFREYTIGAGDLNLVTVGGSVSRSILALEDGTTLVVAPEDPITADETVTMLTGVLDPMRVRIIRGTGGGSTAKKIRVYW